MRESLTFLYGILFSLNFKENEMIRVLLQMTEYSPGLLQG